MLSSTILRLSKPLTTLPIVHSLCFPPILRLMFVQFSCRPSRASPRLGRPTKSWRELLLKYIFLFLSSIRKDERCQVLSLQRRIRKCSAALWPRVRYCEEFWWKSQSNASRRSSTVFEVDPTPLCLSIGSLRPSMSGTKLTRWRSCLHYWSKMLMLVVFHYRFELIEKRTFTSRLETDWQSADPCLRGISWMRLTLYYRVYALLLFLSFSRHSLYWKTQKWPLRSACLSIWCWLPVITSWVRIRSLNILTKYSSLTQASFLVTSLCFSILLCYSDCFLELPDLQQCGKHSVRAHERRHDGHPGWREEGVQKGGESRSSVQWYQQSVQAGLPIPRSLYATTVALSLLQYSRTSPWRLQRFLRLLLSLFSQSHSCSPTTAISSLCSM